MDAAIPKLTHTVTDSRNPKLPSDQLLPSKQLVHNSQKTTQSNIPNAPEIFNRTASAYELGMKTQVTRQPIEDTFANPNRA